MVSIKQNNAASPLPDFRNSGVILRCLIGVNLLTLVAALMQSDLFAQCLQRYFDLALWVQPLLLFNLALLALIGKMLQQIPLWLARALIVLQAGCSAAMLHEFWRLMNFVDGGGQRLLRAGILGALVAGALLIYFACRSRALSPALVEARLQALTARIRPHFLFNSLNAVLSLIRSDPKRAENALEELAELFRALMRDHRELVALADELALCRQYLDLEKLRLAERLNVDWQIGEWPVDLKVPPLLVQPLLENAIYHGIEPAAASSTI
ncbi:MAG TPA: histidine kinase, partial [Accumulibacter sp.]|nr:histidine kinase [Accumulibacter sp.]